MKLNYREKIVAAFLIAIVVLLIGFFAVVKPQMKNIKANKAILKEKQTEKTELENKIKEIPKIQEQIKSKYNDSKELTKDFVPVDQVTRPTYIDQYMQKFADDAKVTLKSVELAGTSLSPIDYYFDDATDTYADLRKAADVNGTLQSNYDASVAESTALSQRAKESIMETKYGIKIYGTKQHIYDYLKKIKEFDKTAIIDSVVISDYTFGQDAAKAANASLPESKDDIVEIEVNGTKITNASDAQIVISLYSVYEMEEPNVEDTASN